MCPDEPFAQAQQLARLLAHLKAQGINTVVYSGYALEALARRPEPEIRAALMLIDMLTDGPVRHVGAC